MRTICLSLVSLLCVFSTISVLAQPSLVLPQASQRAEVHQRIGYTDVVIVYHSPAVKGRKVWGALIPYGKVWRAGANDNTTISFSDDVTIDGRPIPAGTYGLHMIPGEKEWVVIFSKNHTSWGSYFYNKDEDALRVKVSPQEHLHTEWLDYTFADRNAGSARVDMLWDNVRVSFVVGADVKEITLKHIREQLRGIAAFYWHGWEEAANYCIVNHTNYEEALMWIDQSIRTEENYTNLAAKAQLLTLMGKEEDAAKIRERVMPKLAGVDEAKLNAFGYELMGEGDLTTALEVFRLNVKNHPDSWNAYDSMAEAYGKAGDAKQSLANYKQALKRAPEDQKARLKDTIAKIGKG